MSNVYEKSLELHKNLRGKLSVISKTSVNSMEDLSLAYTPGVAEPCKEIHKNEELVYDYTMKGNTVAVVSDGSAVLGLGDIGAAASIPVMEGKAVLFKEFGDIDAFPICINSKDVDEIVRTVKLLEPVFGGINLEDISAPRCFEVEERLKRELQIPVFHDDQHGTAVVVLAGLINALKLVGKELCKVEIVINGAGSAGTAIAKLLLKMGVGSIIMCDKNGAICEGEEQLNHMHEELSKITNRAKKRGLLKEIIKGADVFIGVSAPGVLNGDMVSKMAKDSIIFAMANPTPEIMPDEAKMAGVRVIGTGRSDFSNQINNVLAFPGIFKGALQVRAKEINDDMKLAASYALSGLVSDSELSEDYILPKPFDKRVALAVSEAVANKARETGVARL